MGMKEKIRKLLQSIFDMSLTHLGAVCLAVLVVILIAGLWPFNFFPENRVSWLQDENGVEFSGQGMIFSPASLNDPRQMLLNNKSITIEIFIRPNAEPTDGIGHILSFYDVDRAGITFLGQWKKHFIIQSRLARPAGKRLHREIGVDAVLEKGRDYFLSVASGAGGTTLYMNGRLAKTYPRHRLLDAAGPESIGFVLGDSTSGENSWKGRIKRLTIYNQAFSQEQISKHYQVHLENNFMPVREKEGCVGLYFFNEKRGRMVLDYSGLNNHLTIPALFRPVKRNAFVLPWDDFRWEMSFVEDTVVNLLGFIPLGFFFTAFLLRADHWERKTSYINVALIGLTISLAIELSQIYLPSRNSQLIDVIYNFIGTAAGILILRLVAQNRPVLR